MKVSMFAAAWALMCWLSAKAREGEAARDRRAQACAGDKEKFCSQVAPGDPRRMLAGAYAHEDKLSGQCSYALYQAASALEQLAAALNYLAEQCVTDIETHCTGVRLGEGRVLECLMGKSESVSAGCNKAIADTVQMD